MNDLLVNEAIVAIKAGSNERGKQLLEDVLSAEPHNEKALLWLTAVTHNPFQRREILRQILEINSQNRQAHRGLELLTHLPEMQRVSELVEEERPLPKTP